MNVHAMKEGVQDRLLLSPCEEGASEGRASCEQNYQRVYLCHLCDSFYPCLEEAFACFIVCSARKEFTCFSPLATTLEEAGEKEEAEVVEEVRSHEDVEQALEALDVTCQMLPMKLYQEELKKALCSGKLPLGRPCRKNWKKPKRSCCFCNICFLRFETIQKFQRHARWHSPQKDKLAKDQAMCPNCKRYFVKSKQGGFQWHMTLNSVSDDEVIIGPNGKVNFFVCSGCQREFSGKHGSTFYEHRRNCK